MSSKKYFNIISHLKNIPDCSCDCKSCKLLCAIPCVGTPKEIEKIIENGYADKLILRPIDYFYDNDWQTCFILCPSKNFNNMKCSFQNDKDLCELHKNNLKPCEGRKASCKRSDDDFTEDNIRTEIALLWEMPHGKKLIRKWCKERNLDCPYNYDSPAEYMYHKRMYEIGKILSAPPEKSILQQLINNYIS